MDRRLYFLLGDLLANGATGALVGLLAVLVFAPGTGGLVAMALGMLGGMVVATPLAFLFAPFFGAMEVMLPVMATGMTAGMVGAMAAVRHAVAPGEGAGLGAATGVATWLLICWLNARLTRRGPSRWTS